MPVCVPACPCPLPLAPIQPWEEAPSPDPVLPPGTRLPRTYPGPLLLFCVPRAWLWMPGVCATRFFQAGRTWSSCSPSV